MRGRDLLPQRASRCMNARGSAIELRKKLNTCAGVLLGNAGTRNIGEKYGMLGELKLESRYVHLFENSEGN